MDRRSGNLQAARGRGLRRAVAWGGALLFAASLGYFVFSYAVTFGEIASGPVRPLGVAANVALFSVFALHHSVFARERVRSWVARTAGPALERPVYVWAASLMLIAVCAWWQPVAGVAWQATGPLAWVLRGLQAAGVWLSLRSAAVLDVWELAGVRTPPTPNAQLPAPNAAPPTQRADPADRPDSPGPSHAHQPRSAELEAGSRDVGVGSSEFKTDGPYGWVRHPIYLGWLLLVFCTPSMTMTRLVFALTSSAYVLIGLELEERSLRRLAGGGYAAYARTVRHKLIPGVY